MTLSNAVKQRIVDLATGNQITIHKLALIRLLVVSLVENA